MTFLSNENAKKHNAQDENLHFIINRQNTQSLRDEKEL